VPKIYDANEVMMFEELCPDSEVVDPAGYTVRSFSPASVCSFGGLCLSLGDTAVEEVKEKMTPVLTLYGPSEVTITEGETWELCPPGVGLAPIALSKLR
jgi:hypothetical protein